MERRCIQKPHFPLSLWSSQQQQPCTKWMFQDVPCDITIDLGDASFMLHKFPLISQSGRIRKLIAEYTDASISRLELHSLPGGAESFELAAKFCYGVNFEITSSNVAQLCCVSDYLEMTEDYANVNLASRSEAYLDGVVCKSLEMCIEVLHQCENLLPLADELKIVGRCADAIASKACAEQMASSFACLEYSSSGRLQVSKHAKSGGDWWIEDLCILRIDMYKRVIEAMKCRGVHPGSVGKSLVIYAEKILHRNTGTWSSTRNPRSELVSSSIYCEEKLLVETIASLLPVEKLAVPINFLFGLLRTAIMLDCMMSCRLNLERRIGSQLEMASLDDLLIPSYQHAGETLFDVDTVHRILVNFSQQDNSEDEGIEYDSGDPQPPSQSALIEVARLVDSYLAEIASDANLRLAKFIVIADTLPGYARMKDDGLYRAIDIYLKAHQGLSDLERKRLCKLIDFQNLSEDASAHAAQNERLPLQAMVQVLYVEQLRLRDALHCSYLDDGQKTVYRSRHISSGAPSSTMSPRDNYASLKRENRELKVELARMQVRLNDLEKEHACMKQDSEKSHYQKWMNCLTRRIRKWNFFGWSDFRKSHSPLSNHQRGNSVTGRT